MTRLDTVPRLAGSAGPGPRRSARLPTETGIVVVLAILMAVLGWLHRPFLEPASLVSLLQQAALPGLLAIGMVFVLTVREIDLSAAAVFHLCAVVAALLMAAGTDPWLAALAGIALGAGIGMLNGLLSLALGAPAIVVTLGTWWAIDGVSQILAMGQELAPPTGDGGFFPTLSGKAFSFVPATVVIFALLAVALHVLLHRTRFGYRVQATGSNPEAAAHAGIATGKTRLAAMALMGSVAGLAGVASLGAHGAVAPGDGTRFTLLAIAAALLGGTRLAGGHGSVIGAAIGMLVVQAAFSGLDFIGVGPAWGNVTAGCLIVLALSADWLGKAWRARRADHRRQARRG